MKNLTKIKQNKGNLILNLSKAQQKVFKVSETVHYVSVEEKIGTVKT